MGPDIAAGWLIGIPNVLPHSHAVKALLVDWRPSLLDHPPGSICDYLSHPNARMPYCLGPPVLVIERGGAADDKARHKALLRSLGLRGGDGLGRPGRAARAAAGAGPGGVPPAPPAV